MKKPENKWWRTTKKDVGGELGNPAYVLWADEQIATLKVQKVKDLKFLKEMKSYFNKIEKDRNDVVSREMLGTMINDWIDELKIIIQP